MLCDGGYEFVLDHTHGTIDSMEGKPNGSSLTSSRRYTSIRHKRPSVWKSMIPTSFPSTRPNASASGRSGGGSITRNSGGTVRSMEGQPHGHLPVTRAPSSCSRNEPASGGANLRRRSSARAFSGADKGRSSSSVVAGLRFRSRSKMLILDSIAHCASPTRTAALTPFPQTPWFRCTPSPWSLPAQTAEP